MTTPLPTFVTIAEFAALARLSIRQLHRLRKQRLPRFPRVFELGNDSSKYCACPRLKRCEIEAWLDSRALWRRVDACLGQTAAVALERTMNAWPTLRKRYTVAQRQ
jgi:hypothetical protein